MKTFTSLIALAFGAVGSLTLIVTSLAFRDSDYSLGFDYATITTVFIGVSLLLGSLEASRK